MAEALQTQPAKARVKVEKNGIQREIGGFGFTIFWCVLLFACAGTMHWLRGWICAGSYLITMLALGIVISRMNPGLIAARGKWRQSGTKRFDKIILPIYLGISILQPAVGGLDAVRFLWSSMAFRTLYGGLALFVAAIFVLSWTMAVNPWAESTVRIQADRGQQVVRRGPYRIVRHPMYVAMNLMYPSIALMLGSWWALALSALMDALIVVRTALEDRTLRRELPGYEEYAHATRWRLAPGLW
jgi:protein-S-isoprenylcysteine O-methyltransferase Ste14